MEEARILEESGFSVARSSDVLDGLNKLHDVSTDLIILDSELQMINGEDPYLRIRQASLLPIIILGKKDDLVDALELGADAFIVKPLSKIELVARVRALLRRRPINSSLSMFSNDKDYHSGHAS